MNKNLWNYYKQSEDGRKAIDIFNPETENIWDNIEKIIELLKQWDINENLQYLLDRVVLYNINLIERGFVKEDDIFSREFFEHLITTYDIKSFDIDDNENIEWREDIISQNKFRAKASTIDGLSLFLYSYDSFFTPILLSDRFDLFQKSCDALGIELPPIPHTTNYKEYLMYYYDICVVLNAFQKENELSDAELAARVGRLKIIARARPMDKKRLVEALQKQGEVVAVTGDGTNDAPALNAAHVGLSMGDGTSVAKEASDITIIDNSFASIGRAVMWGRSLYQNIQRFLLFQLTVNVTACFLVLCGAFMGTESPLTVTQMLWINLIMDTFAAMALASLPPSKRVMHDPPRDRNAFILSRKMMLNIVGVGGFFFLLLLALLYLFQHADIHQLTDLFSLRLGEKGHVTPYELTLLFTIFVMTHFFYLFNARAFATGRSALHFKGCRGLLTMSLIILVGQVAMVELPGLRQFFNVTSLRLDDWLFIILASSLVLWVREGWQLISKR